MTTVTVVCLLVGLALPLSSASGQAERSYVRYAKVRDLMIGCSIDRGGRHLGAERRRRCAGLRRRYTLYSFHGTISTSFIRCKTSRCVPHPEGVPDPRGAVPSGAVVVY